MNLSHFDISSSLVLTSVDRNGILDQVLIPHLEKTMIEDDVLNEINKFTVAIVTIADDPKASQQHKAETISKCVELFHQTLMERISLISVDKTGEKK